MWFADSSKNEFFDLCNYVRNVFKKSGLPDVLKEEIHLTKLCEQLSRLLGGQAISFKNEKFNVLAHVSVPDSKYHFLILMFKEPSFIFELQDKNAQSSKKLDGDNIFGRVGAWSTSSKRKHQDSDDQDEDDGNSKRKKVDGNINEHEETASTSKVAASNSKKGRKKAEDNDDDKQKKNDDDDSAGAGMRCLKKKVHFDLDNSSKKAEDLDKSSKKTEDNLSLSSFSDDDDDVDDVVNDLNNRILEEIPIKEAKNVQREVYNKEAEELTDEFFDPDAPALSDDDDEGKEFDISSSDDDDEDERTNEGDDPFEESLKTMISKTKAVKNVKMLDSNFEESKHKAVLLCDVLTKLGVYVNKTSKTLATFKKNKNSTKSEEQKQIEQQRKLQQKIVRKLKTETGTLFNLYDIVVEFVGAINEPLKTCKQCPKHCLFGLTKALPSKNQLKSRLNKALASKSKSKK